MAEGTHVTITGIVQGVGYRAWVEDQARRLNLRGWVRNRTDGSVEAVLFGEADAVRSLVKACDIGPRAALVAEVITRDHDGPEPPRFKVLPTA